MQHFTSRFPGPQPRATWPIRVWAGSHGIGNSSLAAAPRGQDAQTRNDRVDGRARGINQREDGVGGDSTSASWLSQAELRRPWRTVHLSHPWPPFLCPAGLSPLFDESRYLHLLVARDLGVWAILFSGARRLEGTAGGRCPRSERWDYPEGATASRCTGPKAAIADSNFDASPTMRMVSASGWRYCLATRWMSVTVTARYRSRSVS